MAWDPFGVKQRRRNREAAKSQMEQGRSATESLISGIGERSQQAMAEAEMTPEELYGQEMQQARDRIQANYAAGTSNIGRSAMAGGGDISGRGAAATLALMQSANQAQQDVGTQFSNRAEASRRYNLGRSDMLAGQQLSATSALAQQDLMMYEQELERQRQRKQAWAQFGSDMLGQAIGALVGGGAGGGAGAGAGATG
jgi:hypothetical protein